MMHGRYLPTYRQNEVNQIARAARRGQSLAFVGVAGVGKSNLVRYVRDPFHLLPYVGETSHKIHFPLLDLNTWDGSASHLWQSMLLALLDVMGESPSPAGREAEESENYWVSQLKRRLSQLFQSPDTRVMFILDDCDLFLLRAPAHLIEQLCALRNEYYRDLLSFLLFTKKLPHLLLRHNNPDRGFKFFDLFNDHLFALGVYCLADARQMLTHLAAQADSSLSRNDINALLTLSGGHSRLLYLLFNLWVEGGLPAQNPVSSLAGLAVIRSECHRIMEGLHLHEQEAAIQAVSQGDSLEYAPLLRHLQVRGILTNLRPLEWFSPILPMTLSDFRPRGEI